MKSLLGFIIFLTIIGLLIYFLDSEDIVTTSDWSTLWDSITSKITELKNNL